VITPFNADAATAAGEAKYIKALGLTSPLFTPSGFFFRRKKAGFIPLSSGGHYLLAFC